MFQVTNTPSFCEGELECDPEEVMKELDAEDIATYLDWKATVTKTRCVSSMQTAYKNLQSIYRDTMKVQLGSDINVAIRKVSFVRSFTLDKTNDQNSILGRT